MTLDLPDTISLRTAGLACLVMAIVGMFVYAQFRDSKHIKFDFWDLFLDQQTNRASLDATIVIVCCAVGLWFSIGNNDRDLLLEVIKIMVIYRGVKTLARFGADAYTRRPPQPGPRIGTQVNTGDISGGNVDELPPVVKLDEGGKGVTR